MKQKWVVVIALVMPALWAAHAAGKTAMTDEEELHRVHTAFVEAWNRGDAAAAAAFWTEDGVRVGGTGDVQRGRKEIAAGLDRLLKGRFKGAKVKLGAASIRMLGPEYALYQGPMEIDPGSGRPPMKAYVLDVMKKVQGTWLMLESHPKLFPPPPS
jgi:uncharacterized protein (TIGR02246 family)